MCIERHFTPLLFGNHSDKILCFSVAVGCPRETFWTKLYVTRFVSLMM